MFEKLTETNSYSLEHIDLISTLFDNNPVDPDIYRELLELAGTEYRNYVAYNTRSNTDRLIKRPDISINMNLLKEISTKIIQLYYVGVNMTLAITPTIFNTTQEALQNADNNFIAGLLSEILTSSTIMSSCNNPYAGSIAFANIIKGTSFLTKLKNIDVSKGNNNRFEYKRLKELELELIENRYDNTMVIELLDKSINKKAICILTNKHSWKKVRKMTSKIIDLFPEIIIQETKDEYKTKIKKLFSSLDVEGNDNKLWQDTLLDILKDNERTAQKQTIALEKLLEFSRKEEMRTIRRRIDSYKEQISDYHQSIDLAYQNIRTEEGRLLRVEHDPELKEKILEAFDYINKSKLISNVVIKPEENSVYGCINAPIRYFDPAYAKALFKNIVNDGTRNKHNDLKAFKELFSKLFIEDKYTLYCSTAFKITLYRTGENSPMSYRIQQRDASTLVYIGQPHLDGYGCLGNNKVTAQKACNELDILGLLTVLTTSAQNFNLTDSTVFSHFRDMLLSYADSKNTFRDNETGEWFSFNDFYNKTINTNEFKTTEAQQAKAKYYRTDLNENDIKYITKALKSIGTLYVTSVPAKRIAITLTNGPETSILEGNAKNSAFYAVAAGKTIKLTYTNNTLRAETIEKDYFKFYDDLVFEGDDRQAVCYTDLLDNYHNTTEEMAGTTGDNGMPF